jgi:hypothetical protein
MIFINKTRKSLKLTGKDLVLSVAAILPDIVGKQEVN